MPAPRILLLFSTSALGGAERSLTRMALADQAGRYALATLDGDGPWTEWARRLGASPLVFGREGSGHGGWGVLSLWRAVLAIRAARYSVVYVCGVRAMAALRFLKPLLCGARLVQGVRWNPDSETRLDRAFRTIERWSGGLVDLYIANSSAAARTLMEACGVPAARVRVIYNGLEHLPAAAILKAPRVYEVVTVANLNPRKGHREYLAVIRRVHEAAPDSRFIFIGRDDMDGGIQEAITAAGLDAIASCAGFQADVTPFLARARLNVLPSLWGEGAPTSILEASAWGVPTVAYGIDGIPELVEHEVDGLIVAPRDGSALAAAIVRLLKDEELADGFGRAARAKVAAHFTLSACVEAHAAAFDAVRGVA